MPAEILPFRPRPFPRPRFLPTVNGTVILTLGTGDEVKEEHLDIRAARALLNELADACDMAEHLAREARNV